MFDRNCSTYWCDLPGCGGEMVIDYEQSSEDELVLKCGKCESRKRYKEITEPTDNKNRG